MIDKELFPDEYRAIERLKVASRHIDERRKKLRDAKLRKIEECRRILYGDRNE